VRVAEADQLALGERDDREGALEPRHRGRDRLLERGGVVGDQRADHFGVGGRAEPHAACPELVTEGGGVREIAVVPQRDRPRRPVLDEWLRVRPVRRAGRGVTGVSDRDLAVEAAELLLVEHLRDEAHVPEGRDAAAIRDGDSRRFLAAVL